MGNPSMQVHRKTSIAKIIMCVCFFLRQRSIIMTCILYSAKPKKLTALHKENVCHRIVKINKKCKTYNQYSRLNYAN